MTRDLIYVNGDSFTEGSDLDFELLPHFERHYSYNEIMAISENMWKIKENFLVERKKYHKDRSFYDECMYLEIKKRWSTHLENILGRPVLNLSSQSGSSMQAISYRTIQDVKNLQAAGYNITDIIIQVTSPLRMMLFKHVEWDDPSFNEPRYHPNKFIERKRYKVTSKLFTGEQENIKDFPHLISKENLDESEARYLFDLFLFKNTIENITDARLILVDSMFFKRSLFNEPTFRDVNFFFQAGHYLLQFRDQLKKEIELCMLDCFDADEPDTMTIGGHVTEKIHKRFAEKIKERYFNE